MITKFIFVVALIMPNGEYITKSSFVEACPTSSKLANTTNDASVTAKSVTGTRPLRHDFEEKDFT